MNKLTYTRLLRKNQTSAELLLWDALRNRKFHNVKFRRQVFIDNYIVDFVSFEKRIIIELDGEYHNQRHRKLYDIKRTNYLQDKGFQVIRFWNNYVLNELDKVLEEIHLTSNSLLKGEKERGKLYQHGK